MIETKVTIDSHEVETECVSESEKRSRYKLSVDQVHKTLNGWKKYFSFPLISISLRQYYKTVRESKIPYYSCLIVYIFICLLGNVVTAIVLIKHRQLFAGELNDNHTSALPFQINQSQNFEDDVDLDDAINEDLLLSILDMAYNESEQEDIKPDPSCYEPIGDKHRENAKYWLEGVAILVVGIFGLFGNILSIFVFRRSRGNKGFHTLLIILTISDSLLIIDSFIQKSLLPYFTRNAPLEPDWFKISNPYFWHPFKGIIVTVTIYLMVAISAERFRAVCYPLSKRQSPYKYVSVVIVTAVILKLPRFFHFKLIYIYGSPEYWTTPIIEDPSYIRFSSYWDDLFTTGALPLAISIFFNLKIYLKIKRSAKMNCDRFVGTGLVEIVKPIPRLRRTSSADGSYFNYRSRHKLVARNKKQLSLNMNENVEPSMNPDPLENTEAVIPDFPHKDGNRDVLQLEETEVLFQTPSIHKRSIKIQSSSLRKNNKSRRHSFITNAEENKSVNIDQLHPLHKHMKVSRQSSTEFNSNMISSETTQNTTLQSLNSLLSVGPRLNQYSQNIPPHDPIKSIEMSTLTRRSSSKSRSVKQSTKLKVRTEKSAVVFALVVILFLLTHSYRMALKVYEVALPNSFSIERFKMCFFLKRHHVPVTYYMLFHVNNLLIVVNSSITFVVWYSVSKDFRKQTAAIYRELKEILGIPLKLIKNLLE